jgi:hypothetical protein
MARRWTRRAAPAAMVTVGLTALVAPAVPAASGRWEVILGHFATDQQASAAAARAEQHGYRAVIQPIGPGNVEVEIAAGLPDAAAADSVCGQARAAGLHCSTEQEFHGIPAAWGKGSPSPAPGGPAPAPPGPAPALPGPPSASPPPAAPSPAPSPGPVRGPHVNGPGSVGGWHWPVRGGGWWRGSGGWGSFWGSGW